MEVESAKVLDNGRRIVVDLKRKRAVRCTADVTGAARAALDAVPEMICKRMKSDECGNNVGCYVKKSFLRNYSNFVKSGLPQRVLFYENGEWTDFPEGFIDKIKEDLRIKKTGVEVEVNGHPSLLDFLHMILVDLNTGMQQPLAWIDEAGCCFFPETYSDSEDVNDSCQYGGRVNQTLISGDPNETHEIKLQLEIEVNAADSSKMEEYSEESNTHVKQFNVNEKLARNIHEQEQNASNDEKPVTETKVIGGNKLFDVTPQLNSASGFMHRILAPETVKSMFFKGIGASLCTKHIFGIQRSSSYWAEARFEIFKKQAEITEKYRGSANVRYAWLASSKEAVSRILSHGHGFDELPKARPACGVGIHLASENYSRISASYSDVDENGIHHLVLCRVILGNMELIQPGSRKFHPNKESYDSAVDDIQDPKHYLIWNTNMNTHIFPEYVVSFKIPHNGKGSLAVSETSGVTTCTSLDLPSNSPVDLVNNGQPYPSLGETPKGMNSNITFAEKPPTSPWMPFPLLLAALEENVSDNAMKTMEVFYDQFKKKELTRDNFVKKLRWVTGDKVLKETILKLQDQLPGRESPIRKPESTTGNKSPRESILKIQGQLSGRELPILRPDAVRESRVDGNVLPSENALKSYGQKSGRESAILKPEAIRASPTSGNELLRGTILKLQGQLPGSRILRQESGSQLPIIPKLEPGYESAKILKQERGTSF